MNNRKCSLCYILSAFLIGGIPVLTSCNSENDVYNPNHIQEEAKKAFPVKDIDPNQTWEMSSICNASVSVDEKTGEAYTIKVYTENPYNMDGHAFLLAKTSVTDGQTVNFTFDIPSALQYVYVMKVNEKGYSSVIPVAVENGVMKAAFGETGSTKSTRATSVSSIIQFKAPDPNDTNIFPTQESIKNLKLLATNGEIGSANTYKIDSSVKSINNWASGANMYVTENTTLSSIYIASNSHLYILPGIKLTVESGQALGQSGSLISIGAHAEVIYKGEVQIQANLYNLGSLTINNKLENSTNGYLYNLGTIASNTVNITNSILVNEGKLSSSALTQQGGASFYNSGEVYISGKTSLSANDQKWENQNYFETGEMEIRSSSNKLLNACRLYIKGVFDIQTANNPDNNFTMHGDSYVECGSLYMDQATIKMGNKAFFNVLGEAKFKHNIQGFISTDEGYAILKMNNAVQESKQGSSITYQGKLYIACDNHFTQGNKPNELQYKLINGAQMTSANNADISIPKSNCNPGYNSTPDGGGTDKVQNYAYAFEDMTREVGDYDFNDVVLYVTSPLNGKITATLKAAGATKKLAIRFKNRKTGKDEIVYDDVHTALGTSAGTITNTGIATGKAAETKTFDVGNDFSITADGDFYIVNKEDNGEIHIAEFTTGLKTPFIPYAIRIACANWKWPKERTQITKAYTKFADWVGDMTSDLDWYSNPESIVNDHVIGID